jgi:hypothetical protein
MQPRHKSSAPAYHSWGDVPLVAAAAVPTPSTSAVPTPSTSPPSPSFSASIFFQRSSSPEKEVQETSSTIAAPAQEPCSDSDDDICGPHQQCCGGTLCHGAYNTCVKRLGKGGFQHSRGQVCLSQHNVFQCATCNNVAHSGCWVRTAKGSFMLPSALTSFHCYTCACKKDEEQSTSLLSPTACKNDHEESTSLPTGAQGTAKPCVSEGTTKESTSRTFLSESDLRKHFKACNWAVYNSTETRIYYRCMAGTCTVKFKANKGIDDTWVISNAPTCHSCSAPAPPVLTSLVTLKDMLSDELIQEIERLGVTKSFRSKQIQHHLLQQEKVLVDTKLIHNIVYRVRQKLFGHQGDMIYLLEQQKVAFMCLCTQALLPSLVLMLDTGWLRWSLVYTTTFQFMISAVEHLCTQVLL